ncbi:glycosyltransferase family 2 protein [Neiella sp. HB171785]|uniref:Glycosyltransferase family 2 protein n=1 Tax=Neiella litorisoli TaxID=2771431 RepID=A0A8J6R3N6_9GAMM|nr:glycosyltransferase family 2 protein [Neiella litorisoli]
MAQYNVCMFAHNEEDNIKTSIMSVLEQTSEALNTFYLIANGCSDDTVAIANQIKQQSFAKMQVVELAIGDKCNAWNHYMHQLNPAADVHFFVDADVNFSDQCFDKMTNHLMATGAETVTIAGMPLSGRNRAFYESLVKERSCFFGNLYGLKHAAIERIQSYPFRLPMGLNWIDSFLTKAINTDLSFGVDNLPNRVTYLDGVGYHFEKLSPFSTNEISIYINRIARYELGKIQEKYLDALPLEQWPANMHVINEQIDENFATDASDIQFIKRWLVRKRLTKLLTKHRQAELKAQS